MLLYNSMMQEKKRAIAMVKEKINIFIITVLFLITLLPLLSLLTPGMPFVHDGQDHVARIANFYQSLSEGNFIPRWGGNLNWGYGHPILMFLYPLPSYVASFFHFIGFSFVNSTKFVFGVSYILSGLTMYLWMSSSFGKRAGFIGALLYAFAPYRFVDLYVRGAIGEHVAFIFPPLILYFLFKLSTISKRFTINDLRLTSMYSMGVSLSIAGLILSHNAISLMFLPVIGLYILYLYYFETKRSFSSLQSTFYFLLFGFGLSAFFWIPALFEGKYTLRDIVTAGGALNNFVPWQWLFYSPWNYGGGSEFTKELGIPQWVGFFASFFLIRRTKDYKSKIFLLFVIGLLLFSLFIQTGWSTQIWQTITFLQKFQFPWRFLSLSTFLAAVLGGISIPLLLKSGHGTINNKHILLIVFCFLSIVLTINMWKPQAYKVRPETFYSGIYPGTTDTGESSPIWSTRFMEHIPASPMEVIDGDAVIMQKIRTSTIHEYTVEVQKRTLLLENTVFFPGWRIYIDGNPVNIEYQNPNYRGLMTFYIDKGTYTVKVIFEDTKLRRTANTISIASLVILTILGFKILIWQKR